MNHRHALELLDDFLDGELSPALSADVQRHLDGCVVCRAREGQLRRLVARARALPDLAAPVAELWEGLRRRAETARRRPRVGPGLAAWPIAAAATAVAVVGWLSLPSSSPGGAGQIQPSRTVGAAEVAGHAGAIGRLSQVILNVGDMGAQVAFYRDVMGFAIVYPQAAAGDLARETFVRFDTGGAFLVLHAGRAGRAQRDEPRLSFMTDDLDLARAVLVSRGVEVSRVRSPAPGVLVVDARDPEGNAFHVEARVPAQER